MSNRSRSWSPASDQQPRREFFRTLGLALASIIALPDSASAGVRAMRIGIIGSGQMGGGLGRLWARAGHEILFSSRNPGELAPLVASVGANATAGYPNEAAAFGHISAADRLSPPTSL